MSDSYQPDDLIPLPTQPWDIRPAELPLDVEECRTAIWRENGNITNAAKLLKVPSRRLRAFIQNSPRLLREVEEAAEQIIDMAEDVVKDALSDPDRADAMARFVLGSTRARKRGWGNGAQSGVNVNTNGGNLVIQWANGESIQGDSAKVIEGEVING